MKTAREMLSENIRYYLEKSGMEQSQLAEKLNVSQSSVSHWINGNKYPRIDTIEKIAELFNVNKSDITDDGKTPKDSNAIPLLGTIAAGQPILAIEHIEDYYLLDPKIEADFCLRIKGDSMINVNIVDRDIIFIKKQSCIDNGEIGAILIDDTATLKRFYYTDGKVILQAENPQYAPIIIDKGDVRVLGKLVSVLRDYK